MDVVVTDGLVIRYISYGEADRILTVFTKDLGIIKVLAKGARKQKSHQQSASQLLCYAQFTLAAGKSFYTMRGAMPKESFYNIGQDIEKLALATYLCDLTETFVSYGNVDKYILSFLLNTLYILSATNRPLLQIKAVYEIKLAEMSGFGANFSECTNCGNNQGNMYFDYSAGGIFCSDCADKAHKLLSKDLLLTFRYIISSADNKVFNFKLSGQALKQLNDISERYILLCAEKDFKSLEYFNNIYLN